MENPMMRMMPFFTRSKFYKDYMAYADYSNAFLEKVITHLLYILLNCIIYH